MSYCNLPAPDMSQCDDGRKRLIERLTISEHDDNSYCPLSLFLEKVKNDPHLSISLTPIFNEMGIARWTHVCEIKSMFYKTRTFNVTLI